jgi:PPM family protein phosphatase
MIGVTAWTHVGRVRPRNEDVIALPGLLLTGSPTAPVEVVLPDLSEGQSFAISVVDGMGGHVGGQEASRFIGLHLTEPLKGIDDDLAEVNRELYDEMDRRPELRSMGATVAGVRFAPGVAEAFNVGDARIYQHRGGFTSLVSVDDRAAIGGGVVTQCLGGTSRPVALAVHVTSVDLDPPPRLLLCSDGLSEYVSFTDIQSTLDVPNRRETVEHLVQLALSAGAPDNVSVVVID